MKKTLKVLKDMSASRTWNKNLEITFSTDKFMNVVSVSKHSWPRFSDQNSLSYDESKEQLTNFLKTYFTFTYYLGTSPFCFTRDAHAQRYSLKTWNPQRITCGLLHILCLFVMIGEFRTYLPQSEASLDRNPIPYFKIVLGVCLFCFKAMTLKRFWFNQADFLKVLNTIMSTPKLLNTRTKVSSLRACNILFSAYVIQALIYFFGGYTFATPSWNWTPSWWFRRLIVFGKFSFGFTEFPKKGEAPTQITVGDVMLSLPTMLAYFQRTILSYFCDLFLLASTLTLWSATSSMAIDIEEKLEREDPVKSEDESLLRKNIISVSVKSKPKPRRTKEEEWSEIYLNFRGIQALSKAINHALGSQVTWYMAEALMYYSINFNSVLLTEDWFRRVQLVLFYAFTFVNLYLAADACNQCEAIKLWLTNEENIKDVPSEEALLVFHEMIVKDIGIRGSNVFTLTFPLVATFLSLIITFFIICVQQNHFESE